MARLVMDTPLGALALTSERGALVALDWSDEVAEPAPPDDPVLAKAAEQLTEYFAGKRRAFDLPLAPRGTPFRQRVWRAMLDIPYGETRSYGDVARALESGPRAVGGACGANPLPVIVPCHRILAAAGLGGYSGRGGLEVKQFLLRLEARHRV